MMIFGLGSGRCGTHSLAEMLNAQTGCLCFQELHPSVMAWSGAERNVHATVSQFDTLLKTGISTIVADMVAPNKGLSLKKLDVEDKPRILGDIAFYYLPYVEIIAESVEDVRFPCLRRDREATVLSFAAKLEKSSCSVLQKIKNKILGRSTLRNHWSSDKKKWQCDPLWDRLFPQYNLKSTKIEDYAKRWYDDYYERAELLERKYHDRFHIFNMADLNSQEGQQKILSFCGVDIGARAPVFQKFHVDRLRSV